MKRGTYSVCIRAFFVFHIVTFFKAIHFLNLKVVCRVMLHKLVYFVVVVVTENIYSFLYQYK